MLDIIDIVDSMDVEDIIDLECITKLSTINDMIEFGYAVETNIDSFKFIERFVRRFYNKEISMYQLLFLERLLSMSFFEDKFCPIETNILDNIGLPHIGCLEFVGNIPFKKSGIPLTNGVDFIHSDIVIKFYWNTMKTILVYTGNSDVIIIVEQLLISYKSFMRNRMYISDTCIKL